MAESERCPFCNSEATIKSRVTVGNMRFRSVKCFNCGILSHFVNDEYNAVEALRKKDEVYE